MDVENAVPMDIKKGKPMDSLPSRNAHGRRYRNLSVQSRRHMPRPKQLHKLAAPLCHHRQTRSSEKNLGHRPRTHGICLLKQAHTLRLLPSYLTLTLIVHEEHRQVAQITMIY